MDGSMEMDRFNHATTTAGNGIVVLRSAGQKSGEQKSSSWFSSLRKETEAG